MQVQFAVRTLVCLVSLGVCSGVFAGTLTAGTITESVACSVRASGGPVVTQTGTEGCFLTVPVASLPGGSYARGSIAFAAADNTISGTIIGDVRGANAVFSSAEFTGNLLYTDALTTSGPIRPGYLQYAVTLAPNDPFDGNVSGRLGIGAYITFDTAPLSGVTAAATIPVTIGVPFTISLTEHALIASNGEIDGLVGGGISASASFYFFEADGITPVRVQEAALVPEPATIRLLALSSALIGLGFGARRRVKLRLYPLLPQIR